MKPRGLDDCLHQHVVRVSNVERQYFGADRVPPHVERGMRERMADFISRERIEINEGEFSTEYRLRLYVLSPDALYGLIQREAMEMLKYMHPLTR